MKITQNLCTTHKRIQMNKIYKIVVLSIFFTSLNAEILKVEQLFNKDLATVKKESISQSKTFYAKTVLDEESIVDVVTRYDGFITKLDATKTYMNIKKGDIVWKI